MAGGELSKKVTDQVREKLELVSTKLKKMDIAKNAGPLTNGMFNWNGRPNQSSMSSVNIHKEMNLALLISILGFLLTRKKEYDEAAVALEMTTFPVFTWSGYSIDAWKNDINARVNTITHEGEIKRLTKIKEQLSQYISEEDRVMAVLESIDISAE